MTTDGAEARAHAAALAMQRNRADLRNVFGRPADRAAGDQFPRSATMRWVLAHLTPRAIAWTALTTVLARVPFGNLISSVLFARRR